MNKNNVLFIGDLHAPFILPGYLKFIKSIQKKYNCGTVIFAGDIIDGHAWNYHEHDPDGKSVGDELDAAIKQLKAWYKAFPKAYICLGNHDLLISRKAKTAGLSSRMIRDFGKVVEAPKGWKFDLQFIFNDVVYKHGTTGDAFNSAKESRMSTCQGHFHTETFIKYSVSEKDAIFGLQIGWGGDRKAYAFDYGKSFNKKPVVSCGVVLENGKLAFPILMNLNKK